MDVLRALKDGFAGFWVCGNQRRLKWCEGCWDSHRAQEEKMVLWEPGVCFLRLETRLVLHQLLLISCHSESSLQNNLSLSSTLVLLLQKPAVKGCSLNLWAAWAPGAFLKPHRSPWGRVSAWVISSLLRYALELLWLLFLCCCLVLEDFKWQFIFKMSIAVFCPFLTKKKKKWVLCNVLSQSRCVAQPYICVHRIDDWAAVPSWNCWPPVGSQSPHNVWSFLSLLLRVLGRKDVSPFCYCYSN